MAMIMLLLMQEFILKNKVQSREVRTTTATVVLPYIDQLKSISTSARRSWVPNHIQKPHDAKELSVLAESREPVISRVKTTRKLPESTTRRQDAREYMRQNIDNETLRVKRFAYEDTHEWPKTDSLDYDFDEGGETEELALWEKIGRNWQPVLARGMFMFAGGVMLLIIICCCCQIWCRICCQSLRDNICAPCIGIAGFLSAYYEDPMYKKAKNLASLMGLELDYETYMKIKDKFEMQGSGPYNPLGLPHMQ